MAASGVLLSLDLFLPRIIRNMAAHRLQSVTRLTFCALVMRYHLQSANDRDAPATDARIKNKNRHIQMTISSVSQDRRLQQ